MIGLDTNVLVRYFSRDDDGQFARARSLIRSLTAEEPGFIPLVTLAELHWVMRSRYRLSKPQLVEMLTMLLSMQGFVLERADAVALALRRFVDSNADFSDCLIACCAAHAGCAYTVTFDEQAAGSSGMRLVP